MDRDQIVCKCREITYGMVMDAVEMGATNYQTAFNLLHFGVGCGGCRTRIKQMVYLLNIEKRKRETANKAE